MNLRENETLQYRERPGEPDCAYYIRTGLCRFGMTCKFNHPANRKMVNFQYLLDWFCLIFCELDVVEYF